MARIAFYEDDPAARRLTEAVAKLMGHEIVSKASTRDGALAELDRIAAGDIDLPDAYIIDRNLGTGRTDGPQIIRRIQELNIGTFIVGNSASRWNEEQTPADEGTYIDYDGNKNHMQTLERLSDLIMQHEIDLNRQRA